MHQLAKHYGLSPRDFSPAIIEACQAYAWPGNLRELESFVKRYLIVGDRELAFQKNGWDPDEASEAASIMPQNSKVLASSLIQSSVGAPSSDSLRSLVQSVKLEAERNAIAAALEKTGWNRKAAARLLKVSYRTLLYKIEQYKMRSSDPSPFPKGNGLRSKGSGFGEDRKD